MHQIVSTCATVPWYNTLNSDGGFYQIRQYFFLEGYKVFTDVGVANGGEGEAENDAFAAFYQETEFLQVVLVPADTVELREGVDEEFLEFVGEVLEEVLRVGTFAYKVPADELVTYGIRQSAGLHNEVIKLLFFVHARVVYMYQVVDTYTDIIHEQGVQNFLLAIKILVDSGFGNLGFFSYLVYAGLVITKLAE
jgi:hypothetical protein